MNQVSMINTCEDGRHIYVERDVVVNADTLIEQQQKDNNDKDKWIESNFKRIDERSKSVEASLSKVQDAIMDPNMSNEEFS